jgi:type I restriction enzyme M protein
MADFKDIVIPEGKVYDYIDKKFRNDTPEEYVRQTIEKRLVNEHKYSPKQIAIEYPIKTASRRSRADIVIFENSSVEKTQDNVYIVIECKKETVDVRNAKEGVDQLKFYMYACPNCKWGMWTNGRQKEVLYKSTDDSGHIEFMDYNDIPSADRNLDDINRPKRTSLKNAYGDNLLFVFKTCHNHIHVNDGLQKQSAFFELLKVIFCKIEDERNIPKPLEFYTTSEERSNPDGQLTVMKRISKIFERVKKKHGKIFDVNDAIKLSPRSLAYIVSELQKYSLLNTNIDIKSKAYEEIVGANLRGDRGEFFTPRNITKMTVAMINPKIDERVLDSSCGTGGFLVTAMTHVIAKLQDDFSREIGCPPEQWDNDTARTFQDRVSDMAAQNFFGFDINPDLVKATKMNMVMNNDGKGNILQSNSLLPPHEWSDEFRTKLAEALGVDKAEIRNHRTLEFFNVIVTNPPFGSKIPVKDKHILEQYELAHVWENDKKTESGL